jgi:hypothetical protein
MAAARRLLAWLGITASAVAARGETLLDEMAA